jgi:tetratricopeptide (TPR) repeat protein
VTRRRSTAALAAVLVAAHAAPALAQSSGADARRRCLEARRAAAVEACRTALAVPSLPRAASIVRQALVDALVEEARFEDAVAVLREGARLAPEDPGALLKLGRALLHLSGNASEAVAVLQASIRLRGDDARAYAELGLALHRLGQHPEAVAAFAEAERLEAGYFEDRPAARASYEAARAGRSWP